MKNLLFLVIVVGAIIVLALYIGRTKTVPQEVRDALESEDKTVETMQQIPAAVKQKVRESDSIYESRMKDALEGIE
ncbi:MAG: hypothetical protein ACLFVQ_10840 [Chitinispirillaceae bacterium]